MNRNTENYIKKFQGKKIFVDFDGTLCEYRYNDHVLGDEDLFGQTRNELLFGDTFIKARPLETTKRFLNNFDFDNIYILGAILTKHEIDQKIEWLKINYPKLKQENIFFIADPIQKFEVLQEFCKQTGTKPKDIVLLDDVLSNLRGAEKAGFAAYHITSIVDWFFHL